MKSIKTILGLGLLIFCFASCDKDEFFSDAQQLEIDDAAIQAYLKEENLFDIVKLDTATNLYYTIEEPGTGRKPNFGETLITHYTGSFLDGEIFDTTAERGPLDFVLGRGDVIQAWDIGFALIEEGTRATFYIPSGLAYGNAGSAGIPPGSILIFEVNLIDIR